MVAVGQGTVTFIEASSPAKGSVVILSGPSGVGKDTLLDAWKVRNARIERVVAATTRAPRPGEVDGIDYHFLSEADFLQVAGAGGFLEFKNVHGNLYGTPRESVVEISERGGIPVLKIDVQGAEDVVKVLPDAITIFVMPPSEAALERRMRQRGLDNEATIALRLEGARREMECSARYRYRVVNDDLHRAVDELQMILEREGA